MAVLGIFTGQGFTKELYEELRKEVDWENNPPAGIILHAAEVGVYKSVIDEDGRGTFAMWRLDE
jgi:hypothetical protein